MVDFEHARHDDEQHDDRPDATELLEEFEIDEPLRLADLDGFDDPVTKLRETFVTPLVTPVRTDTAFALCTGSHGSGPDTVARAVAGTLQAQGYSIYRIETRDGHRELEGHDQDPLLSEIADAIAAEAPAAIHVPNLEDVPLRRTPFSRVLQELLDRDTDVAVLADLNLRPGPQQDLNRFVSEGWVDVRIHLEDTRTAHLRSRLQGELESLGTREGIDCDTEALDLDPVVSVVTDVANAPAERVVRRAADLTVTDAVENPDATLDTADLRLSQSHLDQAAEQIAAEWGGDYDEGWGPGRNDSTEITDADVPDVSFGDIGGLVDQKSRLQEVLTYPSEYADLYTDTKFESSHGVLLTGPPGTGKTMLAKALANETDRTFFAVNGAELKSMWYGQTEQRVQELFETARDEAPSLVFFDEFDAFAGRRDEFTHEVNESVVGTLLAELDGLEDGDDVLVVASTNRPDTIDPAVRRPGRLGETIEVPAPNVTGRKEIAALYLADVPTTDDVTPAWVANYLPEGATGATIEDVCRQALEAAIRDSDTSDDGEGVTVAREHVTAVIESNQAGSERVDPTYQ